MEPTTSTRSHATIRKEIIFLYSFYNALDTYCSTIGYLDHESDFLSWFFPDLLATGFLAAYVFGNRHYSLDVDKYLNSWTYMIGCVKPGLNIVMCLEWFMKGRNPEVKFYS